MTLRHTSIFHTRFKRKTVAGSYLHLCPGLRVTSLPGITMLLLEGAEAHETNLCSVLHAVFDDLYGCLNDLF